MKRAIWKILYGILCLGCIAAIFYPLVSNYLYDQRQDKIITDYTNDLAKADTEILQTELIACQEYNKKINQISTVVVDGEQRSNYQYSQNNEFDREAYEERLNLTGNGVMGYLIIPKININLPVSHYTTADVLDSGVGHLPESSLPVGGESTHAVLTGHTGSTDKNIFTDLDQLTEGDHFYFSVLGETLVYEVDQILTVLPYDIDALLISQGEDLMTLVTCTPYGINTHRLLVRGHRVEITDDLMEDLLPGKKEEDGDVQEAINQMIANDQKEYSYSGFRLHYIYALQIGAVIAAGVIALYLGIAWLRRRHTARK